MAVDVEFLRSLCLAPGPSGFEGPVQDVARRHVQDVVQAEADPLGNLWADLNPTATPHIIAVGHADQIGLIATWVDDHGYVYFDKIGGVDPQLLPGRSIVIATAQGPVAGVIGRRPTHIIPEAERGKAPELNEQFIDIGAGTRDEALQRVGIGDSITFAPQFIELSPGRFATLALDNRVGVYVAFQALKHYAANGGASRFTAISTVHEETTFMGARAQSHRLQPDVAIVVDGDFASDTPAADARKLGGEVNLGAGPVLLRGTSSNEKLLKYAAEVAKAEGIAVQIKACGGETQTDADELMAAGRVAMLCLGVPTRYMHSPCEVADGNDVEAAARLVAALAQRLDGDFEPGLFLPAS